MKVLFMLLALLAQPKEAKAPDYITWSKDIGHIAEAQWDQEIKKRFNNPVVLICHGTKDRHGKWALAPDWAKTQKGRFSVPIRPVAYVLKFTHINRPVLLIVCNTTGEKLGIDNVYHALNDVRVTPDYIYGPFADFVYNGKGVGKISDFDDQWR